MKNRASSSIFKKLGRGLPKEHPHKFEANPYSSLRVDVQ